MREQIPQSNKDQVEKAKKYEIAKMGIASIFKTYTTKEERADYISSNIDEEALKILGIDKKEIITKLEIACMNAKTKEEFAETVFKITKPIIDLKIENPEHFIPGVKREQGFIEINELFSCEIRNATISIHILPEEKIEGGVVKFKEGLQKLAEIVNERREIKIIEAESWIVASHPKVIEKFGFKIDNKIKEGENKIFRSFMERDDFLKKYLKK